MTRRTRRRSSVRPLTARLLDCEWLEPRRLLAGDASITIDLAAIEGAGVAIFGVDRGDRSGRSVSNAGDFNGDGFDDLIIGSQQAGAANNSKEAAGEAYIVFGGADLDARSTLDLADLGTAGVTFLGADPFDATGKAVSSAGDVNGDGFDDVLIGAERADAAGNSKSDAGETYLIFGKADWSNTAVVDLGNLGSLGVVFFGADAFDRSGWVTGGAAGDVNGDGLDDVIIGAPYADGRGNRSSGAGDTYLIFGKRHWSRTVDLSDPTTSVRIHGEFLLDKSGRSVSGAGDLNGDGLDDIVIGAPNASPNQNAVVRTGIAYIVFGRTDWSEMPSIELSELEGKGIKILGADLFDDTGASVSGAGDVNGDGLDDLLIGAYSGNSIDNRRAVGGESYLLFGRHEFADSVIDLARPQQGLITFYGADAEDRSGKSVSGAGDINGDGFDDLIIGSDRGNSIQNSRMFAGESHVVFGRADWSNLLEIDLADGGDLFIAGADPHDRSGRLVSRAGDVDGDGFDDVIIGAYFADARQNTKNAAGDSYLVFGADFHDQVTHRGTPAADNLRGGAAADVLIGGRNDDVLSGGGGADVLRGGQGDDLLEMADLQFRRVIGGRGQDTLRWTGSATLDLTVLPDNRLVGIERIELGSASKLVLNLREVLNISHESNTLRVIGATDEQLEMGPGWSRAPTQRIDDQYFVAYTQQQATLLIARVPGDANQDGVFDSSDLVDVFRSAEYEDAIPGNSTFAEGDWDGDGDFTSADLVFVLRAGTYVATAEGADRSVVARAAAAVGDRVADASRPVDLISHAMCSQFQITWHPFKAKQFDDQPFERATADDLAKHDRLS